MLREADLKFIYSISLRTMLESHFKCVKHAGIENGSLSSLAAAQFDVRCNLLTTSFFSCGAQLFDPQQRATRSGTLLKRLVKVSKLSWRHVRRSRAVSAAAIRQKPCMSSAGFVCFMRQLSCKEARCSEYMFYVGSSSSAVLAASSLLIFQLAQCYAPTEG